MMGLEQEVQDNEVPLKRKPLSGAIELRDVTFSTRATSMPRSAMFLTIQPGEKVGSWSVFTSLTAGQC
jgi:ATP-binding cassette subfamily C protein LapB